MSLFSLTTFKLASALVVAAAASQDFDDYMLAFGRSYKHGSIEFEQRQELFHKRLDFIESLNSRPGRLWTAGLNELTDRTGEELSQLRGWRHVGVGRKAAAPALLTEAVEIVKAPPVEVDWSHLAMASVVPNQGGCGSCWAVATASMLQGRYEASTNKTRSFSAQQLVNCVPNPKECGGSGGCRGATVELAMAYIDAMGLEDDALEPYTGYDMTCNQPTPAASFLETRAQHHKRLNGGGNIGLKSWLTLPENKALPLMEALAQGPVAISVGADGWDSYSKGIFDGCPKDAVVNHAVTLFGYGEESGVKYWKIRNSWGGSWGEDGFIRLYRHDTAAEDDAFCGTDHDPASGIACKPYPDAVKVCGMCGMLYDSVAANFAVL